MTQTTTRRQRKPWIDLVKAMCMLCVYVLHSEVYYGTGGTSWGRVVMPFYVNAFFFASGYLWFGKRLKNSELSGGGQRSLCNWLFRLVLPTVLFATAAYVPKMLFHGDAVDWGGYLFNVWGGVSYWFTSALAVAELALLGVWLSVRRKACGHDVCLWALVSGVVFLICVAVNNAKGAGVAADYFPWFWRTGLTYTFVMALGGVYARYEVRADEWLRRGIGIVAVAYIAAVAAMWNVQKPALLGAGGRCDMAGFCMVALGVCLVVYVAKRMRPFAFLQYVGRQSLVFYFLSGVLPAAVGAVARRLTVMAGLERCYVLTLAVAAVSVAVAFVVAKALERYAPWTTDFRRVLATNRS